MDANEFRKTCKHTYVYVEGKACGLVVPRSKSSGMEREYNSQMLNYCGYIEVPYSFEVFSSFSPKQQLAICQATMAKSGLCYKLNLCEINSFFEEG